jgi:hypothetical protein
MRRTFLQFAPNRFPDGLFVLPKVRVPKLQDFHTGSGQPGIAFFIHFFLFRKTMLRTVQLNVQKRFDGEKIKDMRTKRMLSPEFVCRKTAVAQPAPQQFFRPGIPLAQIAGY